VTLNDSYPRFQGHAILWWWISQKRYEIHCFNGILIGIYTRPTQQCHYEWPWVILSNLLTASRGLSATAELLVIQTVCYYMVQLEGHSVERIYLWQRSSEGSVNKTILKPRLALAARCQYVYVGFSRRKILRSSTARWQPIGKAAKFRSLYDIGESNPVPASGLWSGSGSKVNQFVHVPTYVDTQHLIQIHVRFLSNVANAQTPLIRFVVDLLYSLLYNKSTTIPPHYNKPYNKSTTNHISGVWA